MLPAPIIALPLNVTFNTPLFTVNCVLAKFPSLSATLIVLTPTKVSKASSSTVCGPGTVLTGASSTPPTLIVTVSLSVKGILVLSVLNTVNVSVPLKFKLP